MTSIILNVDKNTGKINGFAKDFSLAEYFENIQLFELKFLVPILDDENNFLTSETIDAELPIIGQLYQKNDTIRDVNIVLIVDNPNYKDEEVLLRTPKTLFEVLSETEDTNSIGIASTSQTTDDIITLTIADHKFDVNTKETYTTSYKEEVVKSYDPEKYNFEVIVSDKYFDEELYHARSFMDNGFYSNGEIIIVPGEE